MFQMLPEVAIYPWAGIADPEAAKSKVTQPPASDPRSAAVMLYSCPRSIVAVGFHDAARWLAPCREWLLQLLPSCSRAFTSVSPLLNTLWRCRALQTSSFFVSANSERLGIGGGGCAGHAIEVDRDLNLGLALDSLTFANRSLAGGPAEFACAVLEAWVLQEEDLEGP